MTVAFEFRLAGCIFVRKADVLAYFASESQNDASSVTMHMTKNLSSAKQGVREEYRLCFKTQ